MSRKRLRSLNAVTLDRMVRSPKWIHLLIKTVQIGLFLKSMHSDGCSAILYCSTKTTQTLIRASRLPSIFFGITLHYWRHFLDVVNVLQIWSTLAVCQEFAAGFEPSRNGKIFYKSLPEINVIYFLLIKWAYSSWQKHKCFVLSRYHIFNRTVNSKLHVSFYKILYHL